MAGSYTSTGTYSNLTRLELEALRRGDYNAGGKALTVGDSGLLPEGVIGKGNLNAEPFSTAPSLALEDVYGVRPPTQPGRMLGSTTQTSTLFAESARWFGPRQILDDDQGGYLSTTQWQTSDITIDYLVAGVQSGDLLMVLTVSTIGQTGVNAFFTGVITGVTSGNLTCSNIKGPNGETAFISDSQTYAYLVVRPTAVQLFALPGSGPIGREQSFLAVTPDSLLHAAAGPSIDAINADRVRDLVSPLYALDSSVDRADAVFPSPAPKSSALSLGYRLILYPDNGSGTGPDLTKPITSINPIIDPAIAAGDQRVSIDYKAGIVRFSCAPATGGDIKPSAGCVNATTGRLNVYAVFWAVDLSLTRGVAEGLWATRGLPGQPRSPGRIRYTSNPSQSGWLFGSTGAGNDLLIEALSPQEDYNAPTRIGLSDPTSSNPYRYFVYRSTTTLTAHQRVWKFLPRAWGTSDGPRAFELEVGERVHVSVGDMSNPPTAPGLYNPTAQIGTAHGGRWANNALTQALAKVQEGQFSRVQLKRGTHRLSEPVHVPPGVVIEGEGDATVVRADNGTAFTFGPNTPRGVWEADTGTYFNLPNTQRIEGMDIVWNPVRRVWAVTYADSSMQAIWFNEIQLDGTARFPGLGIDIKNTPAHLYTALSPNSQDHTTGHYPRMAHCEGSDEYMITWVQERFSSPTTGPQVFVQVVTVTDPLDPFADSPAVTKPLPTVTLRYFPAAQLDTGAGTNWSNHPSIAVASDSGGETAFMVTCWAYLTATPGYSSKAVRVYLTATESSPTVANTMADVYPSYYVVSSTDVVADTTGDGCMAVWSVRTHSLVVGTQGKITTVAGSAPNPGTSYLTDAGVGDFAAKGIGVGSKFLWLGKDLTPYLLPVTALDAPSPRGFDFANQPGYGDDGILHGFDSSLTTRPQIKAGFTGRPYNRYTTTVIAFGSTSFNASTTVMTDSSGNFILLGTLPGDFLVISTGGNQGVYEITARTATTLTVTPAFPTSTTAAYRVMVGQVFRFAIAPRSFVQGVRAQSFSGYEPGASKTLAGSMTVPATSGDYLFAETEPDYVRVGSAEDGFMLVYQSMNTTSRLSKDYMLGDTGDIWTTAPADVHIYLRDFTAPYREHVSTAAVPLLGDGSPVDAPSDTITTTIGDFDEGVARPMAQIRRSLGGRALIGARPNFRDIGTATVTTGKDGQNMADEVSCGNWYHRWTATQAPALLPDLTWNGQDFVVVSPTKNETRSFVGNYQVSVTTGEVILLDATFYFGTGTTLATGSDSSFHRETVQSGDLIYFPSQNVTTQISDVLGAHAVLLADDDGALFQAGQGALLTGVEWVLLRNGGAQHGPKKPGFRVSRTGEVLASAGFITFAQELSDGTDENPTSTLMNRGPGADRFNHGAWNVGGVSFPATLAHDAPTPARWQADIGFRGPAVGSTVGTAALQPTETSLVALAWGETAFAVADRELAGSADSSIVNTVQVRRQSFGPYHNGLSSLRIEGSGTGSSDSIMPLVVGTHRRVHIRHGDPTGSQGFFATDGYQNCFVFAARRNHLDAADYTSVLAQENYPHHIEAIYTDAVGLDPLRVDGPVTRLKADASPALKFQDAPFAQEFSVQSDHSAYPNLAAAPRVVWDGRDFAAVWWETSILSTGVPYLRFSTFPGDGHDQSPHSELVSPADALAKLRAPQEVTPNGFGTNTAIGTVDLATSGRTYAAAWTYGVDRSTSGSVSTGGLVAVTIFSPSTNGNSRAYDCQPTAYYATSTASSNPGYLGSTQDQDYKVGYIQAPLSLAGLAAVGDILVVSNTVAIGRYRVIGVSGAILYLDRWVPSSTNINITLHKSKSTPGAKTYVLDTGIQRTDLGPPTVIWNGQEYVVAWRASGSAQTQGGSANHLMIATLRETGVGSPSTVVATSMLTPSGINSRYYLIEPSVSQPSYLYMAGSPISSSTSTAGSGGTSIITSGTSWVTLGVAPGSVIRYGSTGNVQLYTATFVTATTITVDRTLHISGSTNVQPYGWTAMPRIKVGDVFQGGATTYDSTPGTSATFRVLAVDPLLHRVQIEYGLPATTSISYAQVYGSFINEATGDPGATNDTSAARDDAVTASPVTPHHLGRTTAQGLNNLGRVYGLTYNPDTNLYVALIGDTSTGSSQAISLVSFDRRTLQAHQCVPVSSGVSSHLISSVAFNGQHYLVVWASTGTGGSDGLFAALYDAQLRPLGSPRTVLPYSNMVGMAPLQVPGDGVIDATTVSTVPLIRNVQVKWNDTLCRWAVSYSVSTYAEGGSYTASSTQLPPERRLTVTTIDGYTNNRFLFNHTGGLETNAIAPGSKLFFRYNYVSSPGSSSVEMVAEVLAVDYAHDGTHAEVTLNVDATSFPRLPGTYLAGDITVGSREDVFLMTLAYPNPTLKMVDPDGVRLENLTLTGAVDIEERWKYLGRSFWRASGYLVGATRRLRSLPVQPTVPAGDTASIIQRPKWVFRLPRPSILTGLEIRGLRSRARNRHRTIRNGDK